jgi:hypothetical protein
MIHHAIFAYGSPFVECIITNNSFVGGCTSPIFFYGPMNKYLHKHIDKEADTTISCVPVDDR